MRIPAYNILNRIFLCLWVLGTSFSAQSQSGISDTDLIQIDGRLCEVVGVQFDEDTLTVMEQWHEFAKDRSLHLEQGFLVPMDTLSSALSIAAPDESDYTYYAEIRQKDEKACVFFLTARSPLEMDYPEILTSPQKERLESLLMDIQVFINTGFMEEDQVPSTNEPAELIEKLKPTDNSEIPDRP